MTDRVIEEMTLLPNQRASFGAEYGAGQPVPRLAVRVDVPRHALSQVICEERLRNGPESCRRDFFLYNKSNWPAFLRFVEIVDDVSTNRPQPRPTAGDDRSWTWQ